MYDCEAIARYDCDAIIGEACRAASFAMPCGPVGPRRSSSVKRIIRFDDDVLIEQVPTDTPFKDYRYARDQIRTYLPKPVVRNPNGINLKDLMSHAVARFRAIELANGRGLVNDPYDTEMWRGVEKIDPKENRKLPVIWTNNGYVIILRSDPDGFASYGRVHWHGSEGLILSFVTRDAATRVQTYSCDEFENI
eukprot:13476657-Heterocapsa_arctica.AAC.1